jgi:type IV fimbrial biogenesis protein FimT
MRARGFTLIEALVVLSIAAIVLAIGAPNLSFLIGSMRARSATFELVSDLTLARSEAIKRNQAVTVEPIGSANGWSGGWQIVTGGVTLRQHPALPPSLTVASDDDELVFQPNGRIGTNDTLTASRKWEITSTNASPRCVVITPTGSARSKHGVC